MIQLCKSLGKQCWIFVANGILSYIDNENQLYFQNFFFFSICNCIILMKWHVKPQVAKWMLIMEIVKLTREPLSFHDPIISQVWTEA